MIKWFSHSASGITFNQFAFYNFIKPHPLQISFADITSGLTCCTSPLSHYAYILSNRIGSFCTLMRSQLSFYSKYTIWKCWHATEAQFLCDWDTQKIWTRTMTALVTNKFYRFFLSRLFFRPVFFGIEVDPAFGCSIGSGTTMLSGDTNFFFFKGVEWKSKPRDLH